jgi:RHS repeat-associated protein
MSLTVDDGSPVTTDYAWDLNRGLPVVLDDGTNEYVYGLDFISATDSSDNQAYYTHDALGSTTDLTDDGGSATDSYSYDVFGAVRDRTGTSANPFQFTGQQTDADSGLQYLRARHYDPATGRFLGRDPLNGSQASPQSQNPFAYSLNNPINFVDPSGQRSIASYLAAIPRPTFDCRGRDVACVGTYLGALWRYNDVMFRALKECAIWGIGGSVAGPSGIVGGCLAGALVVVLEELFGPSPILECASWAVGGALSAGSGTLARGAGAGIGCLTGIAGYYAPESEEAQCATWLLGAFSAAKVVASLKIRPPTDPGAVRGGVAGCIAGAASANQASTAYAGSTFVGGGGHGRKE